MRNTILSIFLKALDVKYTNSFSDKLYSEHPHRYNLYGLSTMLNTYKIPNTGVRFDKNELKQLDTPFIAHVGNDFVVVKKIVSERISYVWKGKQLNSSIEDFNQVWSGVVLLAEPTEQSAEPDYKKNKMQELLRNLQNNSLWALLAIVLVIGCYTHQTWLSTNLITNLALSLAGVGIGYLLLLKQRHTKSEYADKLCSLFHQGECNNILESDAAKIGGIFSWSEIGLGYFASNVILILFFPELIVFLSIINVCTLPYTLWSVWYQYKIAKQWCALCLIVQILLWLIFLCNLSTGQILMSPFTLFNLLIVGVIYSSPILLINLLFAIVNQSDKLEGINQEFNNLKMMDDIFLIQLKHQPYYSIDKTHSCIILGNPDAALGITILTNPHCEPCAKMHKKINALLASVGDKAYVQYVFSAFDDGMLRSNRFLIAAYLQGSRDKLEAIYSEWFMKGKYTPEEYFARFNFQLDVLEVNEELAKHTQWKLDNKLIATPTILVNGLELPEKYKIEDLIYFMDINFG